MNWKVFWVYAPFLDISKNKQRISFFISLRLWIIQVFVKIRIRKKNVNSCSLYVSVNLDLDKKNANNAVL